LNEIGLLEPLKVDASSLIMSIAGNTYEDEE
jgi:hypothetical protein